MNLKHFLFAQLYIMVLVASSVYKDGASLESMGTQTTAAPAWNFSAENVSAPTLNGFHIVDIARTALQLLWSSPDHTAPRYAGETAAKEDGDRLPMIKR